MKLPRKIQILDSTRSTDSWIRFDDWEGNDPRLIAKYMAMKVNEVIAYLEALPQIPNELPPRLKAEGNKVVHEHQWIQIMRMGNTQVSRCSECGEMLQKLVSQGN